MRNQADIASSANIYWFVTVTGFGRSSVVVYLENVVS